MSVLRFAVLAAVAFGVVACGPPPVPGEPEYNSASIETIGDAKIKVTFEVANVDSLAFTDCVAAKFAVDTGSSQFAHKVGKRTSKLFSPVNNVARAEYSGSSEYVFDGFDADVDLTWKNAEDQLATCVASGIPTSAGPANG
ncbi:MAG: hypothetical protein AAF317_08380 [Pseudomonadota bacterium]